MPSLWLSVSVIQRVAFARVRYGGTAEAIARRARVSRTVVEAVLALFAANATARGRLSTYPVPFIEAVVRDYRAGAPVLVVCQRYEISLTTLYRMLDAVGEPRRGTVTGLWMARRRRTVHHPTTRHAAVTAYQQGTPLTAICDRYDVARDTVLRWVEDAGVQLRVGRAPRGPAISPRLAATIVRAYRTTSVAELCRRYRHQGLSPARLRRLLRSAGEPLKRGRVAEDSITLVRGVAIAARRGVSELALKRRFGVGGARLRRLLAAAGMSLARRLHERREWPDARRRKLVDAWAGGASLRQLRKRFRADHRTVTRELLRGLG